MSHKFSIQVNNVDETVQRVKTEMLNAGNRFNGDSSCGRFSGSGVEGEYLVKDTTVYITIHKKPFIASNKLVENKIRQYFA